MCQLLLANPPASPPNSLPATSSQVAASLPLQPLTPQPVPIVTNVTVASVSFRMSAAGDISDFNETAVAVDLATSMGLDDPSAVQVNATAASVDVEVTITTTNVTQGAEIFHAVSDFSASSLSSILRISVLDCAKPTLSLEQVAIPVSSSNSDVTPTQPSAQPVDESVPPDGSDGSIDESVPAASSSSLATRTPKEGQSSSMFWVTAFAVAALAFVSLFVLQCVRRQRDSGSSCLPNPSSRGSTRKVADSRVAIRKGRERKKPRRNQTAPAFEHNVSNVVWRCEADYESPSKPTIPRVPIDSDSSPEQTSTDSAAAAADQRKAETADDKEAMSISVGRAQVQADEVRDGSCDHTNHGAAPVVRDENHGHGAASVVRDDVQTNTSLSKAAPPQTGDSHAPTAALVPVSPVKQRSIDTLLQAPTPVHRQALQLPPIGSDERTLPRMQHALSPMPRPKSAMPAQPISTPAPLWTAAAAEQPQAPIAPSVLAVAGPLPAAAPSVVRAAPDVPHVEQRKPELQTHHSDPCPSTACGNVDTLPTEPSEPKVDTRHDEHQEPPASDGHADVLPAIQPATVLSGAQRANSSRYGGNWRDTHRTR